MKGLFAFVLIGARIITFNYVLDDLKFEYADKDSGVFIQILFQPTAENTPFRIIEKSPYNMTVYLEFLSKEAVESIKINSFELILESGETVHLNDFIDWVKIDDEISNKTNFENITMPVSKSMDFRFQKLPLNEKNDLHIKVHIDLDLNYINKSTKKYNYDIPFRLMKHSGRWFPTT
ncbi:hypothetical protein [Treponema sp. UBA3813]|uniref:hypothetical protein n=1 Tax=Treponema sp. UBA3813 TaxID=1947715 RepID=UPI0025F9055E|nr:hypothetical protein [Treponema sp. UBA3813]